MKFLIYILLCIVCLSSVSALDSNLLLQDKVVDSKSLELAFKTTDVEVMKEQIFTGLKSNDALKKEAVFSMDTSKIVEETSLEIVFNEVCGKVKSYEVVNIKDNDYKVNADIVSGFCSDGTFGYKVDWMPKLSIGENVLINQKWSWWNTSINLSNPNMYYVILNATNINESFFMSGLTNVSMFRLSGYQWILFDGNSTNINVSKSNVMNALFYGTNGYDGRLNGSFINGLNKIDSNDFDDVGKKGYLFYLSVGATSGTCYYNANFTSTTDNENITIWRYIYESTGAGAEGRYYINNTITETTSSEGIDRTRNIYNKSSNIRSLSCYYSTTLGGSANHVYCYSYFLTKKNATFDNVGGCTGTQTMFNKDFTSLGSPLFTYNNLNPTFRFTFLIYNNSYSNFNITMTSGATSNNYYGYGIILTDILSNDSRLWNITIGQYYTINNQNISNDLLINRSITYSFSSPSGVFGESSNIVLNLSKETNQSYTNANLIYNGVVYASPTQTEYTDYTLFTQEITNTAIGNFSFYFNVSLTDYGNVFNFNTVNGSHVVSGVSLNLTFLDTNLNSMSGKNVSLTLIGLVNSNFSTSSGVLNIGSLAVGDYTLLSSSSGYNVNSYNLHLTSSFSPLSLYLQPLNVTYYGLVTVKDKYSKDTISGATLTIQRYINNAWVTEQIYTTDFSGQAQGYFVIDTAFYNFLVSIDGVTYFGVINSNANKKVVYAQDITNGIIIEIDTLQSNSYYEFISSQYVSTSLNFTNTSNSTGFFTFRWIDSSGNSRNGTLNVYVDNVLNCSSSAVSSSGIITCSVSAGSPTYFLGTGWVDGVGINSYLAKLGVFNEFSLNWGALGWIMSIFLVIIGYFAFSSIPSMSLLLGTGIIVLMSILGLIFVGLSNFYIFVGFMAIAFLLAKIPSRQGGNG